MDQSSFNKGSTEYTLIPTLTAQGNLLQSIQYEMVTLVRCPNSTHILQMPLTPSIAYWYFGMDACPFIVGVHKQ